MRLSFFTFQFLARMKASIESNLGRYASGTQWIQDLASSERGLRESNLVVDPPPVLAFADGSGPGLDAENAKRVYTWLGHLTPALATEERLWSYLSHVTFADYMRARWPADGAPAVRRRYFYEGSSFASLSRNGIARLWWAGFLTRDSERANPFELTEVLFMRQDIQVSLLERSMGKCANVRTGVLEFLSANRSRMEGEAFGRRIQILLRELNLLGGVAVLDALPPATIEAYLHGVVERFSSS